jgi:hypothetical protein
VRRTDEKEKARRECEAKQYEGYASDGSDCDKFKPADRAADPPAHTGPARAAGR